MDHKTVSSLSFAAFLLLVVSISPMPAVAGPPLICHRFDIAGGKSLSWPSNSWNLSSGESYNGKNLTEDTIAILDSDPVVLVHMETLRRATLYARKDPVAAKELLARLLTRANAAGEMTPRGALASFDVGYLIECYRAWIGNNEHNPAQDADGSALVNRAIQLRGNDPEMEFAAALIAFTFNGPRDMQHEHARLAIQGSGYDPLLDRNLSGKWNSSGIETTAEMILGDPKIAQH
ncbi:MAG: hypothetical protein WAK20_08685 [Candidatus Acidiferrum sp.]